MEASEGALAEEPAAEANIEDENVRLAPLEGRKPSDLGPLISPVMVRMN
jgi:hypothetical protein